MANLSYKDIIGPAYYRAWNDFYNRRYKTMCFSGGRGCIDGNTLIETPSGPIAVKDFKGGEVYSFKDGKRVVCLADSAVRYTKEDLFEVKTTFGKSILVTDEHMFLLSCDNWKMTKDLKVGDLVMTVDEVGCPRLCPVKSVTYRKRDYYYDFCVWDTHNYVAAGFVNHNSLKSSFVSVAIILGLEKDAAEAYQHKIAGDPNWKHYLTHAVCYRKVFGTCDQSVYSQLVWAIDKLGLTMEYECKKSPLKIIRRRTGQMILFRGLDDPLKSKSLKTPFSFFRYCWFEEAAEFDGIEEIRNVRQSVQRGGHDFITFYSYNPPETSANWVNFEMANLEAKDPTFHHYHTDYRSVPVDWLGPQFFAEANLLKSINERSYRHEYLGEITGNGGTVFPNVKAISLTDEDISHFSHLHWGCDFGVVDPTVLIGLEYERVNHRIIIFTEVYESNMLLDRMEKLFKEHYFGYEWIRADCAAKQMIMELENRGLPMLPALKGADSILHGVKFLQNLKEICIDPVRCPNTFKEFSLYEYEKLKGTNQFTDKLPDKMNHAIDSCVTGDTRVKTDRGWKPIQDLVGTRGRLTAYDIEQEKCVLAPYCHVRPTRTNAEVIQILLRNADQLTCTPDHRILTANGYVCAGDLKPGASVLTTAGASPCFSVIPCRSKPDVFDLEVPDYHNFAVGNGMFVHNCRYAIEDLSGNGGFF